MQAIVERLGEGEIGRRGRAWLRDAMGGASPLADPGPRRALGASIALAGAVFAALALARFDAYHNATFDLAFYARMAWGEVHNDVWNPIVNAHVRGLHLSWILRPLGWLGVVFGMAPTLLVAQAFALPAAAWPLARIAARAMGPRAALAVGWMWLLYPNLSAVATGEFHPGSVAVLPLAWALDGLDRRSGPGVVLGALGVLACREDLGLVTCLLGVMAWALGRRDGAAPGLARWGALVAACSLAYALFFALVLLPRYAPEHGSLSLHFGRLGRDPLSVVIRLLTHPGELASHLAAPHRALYPLVIAAPLAFTPLVRPGRALLALPVLAMNLISEFPGTTGIDSHYLTPALPALFAGAIEGMAALRAPGLARIGLPLACAALSHLLAGTTPASISFPRAAFVPDADTAAAASIVARIPDGASVQAPDALLPHLAERRDVRRAPPPEQNTAFVVFDAVHRRRFLHDESLLRTSEEPVLRAWLARPDHALVAAAGDYYLLARGVDPRRGVGARALVGEADPREGDDLTDCLGLLGARAEDVRDSTALVVLDLVARGPCPDDLALRIGLGKRPRQVDLIADGLLSPAHFRRGDRIASRHVVARGALDGLRVGALRESGARPAHGDPLSIAVPLARDRR